MSMILVRDFLETTAQRLPRKVALVCGGKRFSYGEIDTMANRLANWLINAGVERGDRVVIHLDNSAEAVVSIFAVLKASAVFVVVNPGAKADKLKSIVNDCRATALIMNSAARPEWTGDSLKTLPPTLKALVLCGNSEWASSGVGVCISQFGLVQENSSGDRPPRLNIDLDLACLLYTSGSTGEPKGVMSDHNSVVFTSGSIIQYLENRESDIVINVLPLAFGYGLYQLLMTFQFGGTLVLENSFAYPGAILKLIETERVTGFPGVPTIYALLVKMDLSDYDLSSLRYLTSAAAALPTNHILDIRRKFPQAKFFSMYGLTETIRTLYLPPEELDRRPGSVGIPIPGTEAWIEDDSGQRLGPGAVGELVVRGRHVMRGYWESPEATARRYRPGSLPGERLCYTGDLFRQDEDGYFYFVSRSDDIIKSRGEKVAPKEVELVLYELPGVAAAAVVGVPDANLGQAIKAILVLNEGVELPAVKVLAHCRARLEDFMVPRHVEFRDSLPVNGSGKISRKDLK